ALREILSCRAPSNPPLCLRSPVSGLTAPRRIGRARLPRNYAYFLWICPDVRDCHPCLLPRRGPLRTAGKNHDGVGEGRRRARVQGRSVLAEDAAAQQVAAA